MCIYDAHIVWHHLLRVSINLICEFFIVPEAVLENLEPMLTLIFCPTWICSCHEVMNS